MFIYMHSHDCSRGKVLEASLRLTRSMWLHDFVDGNGKLQVLLPPHFREQKNKAIIKACARTKYWRTPNQCHRVVNHR